MPSIFGDYEAIGYTNELDGTEHVALVKGKTDALKEPVLVRMHSECLTGDAFGSLRCDCRPQLEAALARIEQEGECVVVYLRQEGRGIGLWAKAATYILQDEGENTYQANRSLGLDEDSRDFSDAATLIKYFYGNKPFRLLTNNPKKIDDLKDKGLETITPIKHIIGVTGTNREYLFAKKDWGHSLEDKDISEDQ